MDCVICYSPVAYIIAFPKFFIEVARQRVEARAVALPRPRFCLGCLVYVTAVEAQRRIRRPVTYLYAFIRLEPEGKYKNHNGLVCFIPHKKLRLFEKPISERHLDRFI